MNQLAALRGLALVTASTIVTIASAATVGPTSFDVDAFDSIYNANTPYVDSFHGYAPQSFALPANTVSFTLAINSGSVSFNGGTSTNDADGVGAAVASSSNTGTTTISGITAPYAGYLVGVFFGATPSATAPAAIDYTSTPTSFTSFSPSLQQVFFIGDGLTGDGTGSSQTFVSPTGATTLYLGFSDAAGYNGAPGAYDDNSGFFYGAVTFTTQDEAPPRDPSVVPEPAELALLGLGMVAASLVRRKR